MCRPTLHDSLSSKVRLIHTCMTLDHILALEKNTRTPPVYLVCIIGIYSTPRNMSFRKILSIAEFMRFQRHKNVFVLFQQKLYFLINLDFLKLSFVNCFHAIKIQP